MANLGIKTIWRRSMLESSDILCTGGAGTLGHAIARKRQRENWTGHFTVYSTDTHKLEKMKREFPDVNIVQGDIRNPETLYLAMVGHDVVIHAAAVKVIPISEEYPIDTIDVNVFGSQCVCQTAIRAGVEHVLMISTDKAAHAVNTYGATMYMMEKLTQEYARSSLNTQFHLVRFGNVLESNGSVIEAWHKAVARGEPIKITDPTMSRFWLSPTSSADIAIRAFDFPAGCIYIPKLPALSIGKLADYTVGRYEFLKAISVPIRPGEKMHEELLTKEEGWYTLENEDFYLLAPTTAGRFETAVAPFTSDIALELTREELTQLLEEG